MTKAEFQQQFKRLRVAGYRLPVGDGITVTDVVNEWYDTFGSCSVTELAHAIDCLKRTKPDTFWPASGELWAHIRQYRKERRIQTKSRDALEDHQRPDPIPRHEFLSSFRAFRDRMLAKMTMPNTEVQVEPDHVLLEHEARENQS